MQRKSPNNDECYTHKHYIYEELEQYGCRGLFIDKRIICPCDLETSNFYKVLTENKKRWGILSIEISHYNPETGEGRRFQDVNYSRYDLCITNPPFSKKGGFVEFIRMMREAKSKHGMNYIILTPFLNRVVPNIAEPLFLKECYLGFNRRIPMKFINNKDGNDTKSVSVDWITSYNIAQKILDKKTEYLTGEIYDENKYVLCEGMTMKDGTNPIRVNNYKNIPDNYYGWIFCPIGILNVLSYDDFMFFPTNLKGLYNTRKPLLNPFKHKATDVMLNGIYHGYLIKKENNN